MNYQALQEKTYKLCFEHGKPCVLIQVGPGAFDPAKGKESASTVTRTPSFCIEGSYQAGQIDGTLIQAGDISLLLPGNLPELSPGNTIEVNGRTVRVITTKPTRPGGVIVSWEVQAR